jgi:heavy metal sensor kinase
MSRLASVWLFFHSIRFRLVLWFTLILTVVLVVFSAFIYYNQARDIRGDALYHVDRKLSDIEDVLRGTDESKVMLQHSDVLVLLDASGKVLASQGVVTTAEIEGLVKSAQAAQKQQASSTQTDGPDQLVTWISEWKSPLDQYFFVLKSISTPARSGFVILGTPFDPYNLNQRLLFTLLIGNLLTIAVALSGGLWLADRAMRPVHSITQAARTISETDLNRRLNMKSKDELGELANTFDAMLARLQTAFERQRQFVADASHELRTPLTIVNLESNRALAAKRTPQEYQRALGVIRSENEFMSHLVNDLLTLARMDSGQMAMAKNELDLSEIVLDSLERLSPLAERKGVRLEGGDLPEVIILGDRQYLMQMISNLVENGIKYTDGAEKCVRVETGLDGDTAWVRVSDNGMGIPAEHLPQLFTRFYRVDKARSRGENDDEGGNGLGLAIVDWIARAHDGEVRVESQPGQGTTFEVSFNAVQ